MNGLVSCIIACEPRDAENHTCRWPGKAVRIIGGDADCLKNYIKGNLGLEIIY